MRAFVSVLCLAGASVVTAACSDGAAPASKPPADGGAQADAPSGPALDADVPDDDAGTAPETVDEPDTDCASIAATETTIAAAWSAETGATTPIALVSSGARRAAIVGGGLVTMADDGSGATGPANPFSLGGVVALNDSFAAAALRGGRLEVQRYSLAGVAGAFDLVTDTRPNGYAIGASATTALVAWATSYGAVYARAIGGGPPKSPFIVRALGESQMFRASIVDGHDGTFMFAFSGETVGATAYRLGVARTTDSDLASRSTTLLSGPEFVRVTALARTATGFALLYEANGGARLATLGRDGRFTGKIRRLVGTLRGFSLATRGDRVGVLAWRRLDVAPNEDAGPPSTDLVAFRAFDATGAPASAWRCFDAPAPIAGDFGAALSAEPAGWAAIRRKDDGSVVLSRFSD